MDRKKLITRILAAIFLVFSSTFVACAQHDDHHPTSDQVPNSEVEADSALANDTTPHEKGFDLSGFILHHVSDDYSFHVVKDIYVWLPVIIYDGNGFDVFSSKELHHPDHVTHLTRGKYYYHHGKLTIPELDDHGRVKFDDHGHPIGKTEAKLTNMASPNVFFNFSITKNVFGLFLSMSLMFLIFISVARAYKKRGTDVAPRGLQNAMEALILFVKNEIAEPFIGKEKTPKFLPYLLTVFFFIWINNLLGLIPIFPGSANVSGNIAFTFTLAFLSLCLVFIFGRKHFWGHIFWYPGVPVPVKLLLAVLEFLGVFTKPFSLMIRLFANITAGHIIIMSIIGITFITQNYIVGGVTSVFSVVMFVLELLVAAIQAYIFTLLTAQMIGAAIEEPHHKHEPGHADQH
jgi:F-type H+-transporting ATPase subunit a